MPPSRNTSRAGDGHGPEQTGSPADRVSAIVPVRNGEAFLKEALTSLQQQIIQPAEIIVVDDGSTDRSAEIALADPNVTCLRQGPLGQAAARNAGVGHATMPLVAFLDADDLWPPDKLARQTEALALDPELDAVFGHTVEFSSLNSEGIPIAARPPIPGCLPGALLIRRAAFLRVGGYSLSRQTGEVVEQTGEVIDWFARAADLGIRMEALPDIVLWRRIHDANLGRRVSDPSADYLRVLRAIIQRRRKG